jgi:hypothetical protein
MASFQGAGLGAALGTLVSCFPQRDYRYQWDLVGAALWVTFAVLYWQCAEIDDDFWIHSPVQSLVEFRGIPPGHPYFPELTLQGHYGRDLVISGLAYLLGAFPISSQIWLTALVHGCLFLLLTDWLRSFSLPGASVRLGAGLFFVATCVGARVGFLDCYQNNNSFAFAFNFLALTACQDYFSKPDRWNWLRMLCALSFLGVCYEMLWGLLACTLGLLHLRRPTWKFLVAAVVCSAVITLSCSGSLKHIFARETRVIPKSFGEATQRQSVRIRFPSSQPGFVYMTPTHSRVVSVGFSLFPASVQEWVARFPFSPDQKVFVLSPSYLRQHWFATWLAPFILGYALWRRSLGLLAAWLFGALALFVPSLVEFGAVYDHENFRWSYTAGAFFTVSFGVALGLVWHQGKAPSRVLVVALALLTACPGLEYYRRKCHPMGYGDMREHLGRSFNAMRYYAAQKDLQFHPALRDAALWLSEHASPGQVVLADLGLSQDVRMYQEATLLAVSRLRSSGHAYPTASDPVGTQPYRTQAWYRAFWAAPQRATLEGQVDWVLQTRNDTVPLQGVEGFDCQAVLGESGQRVAIYRLTPALPATEDAPRVRLKAGSPPPTAGVELGSLAWLEVECQAPFSGKPWAVVLEIQPRGEGIAESYRWSFRPQKNVRVPVAAPSQPGAYLVSLKAGETVLTTFPLQVVQPPLPAL